MHYLWFFLATLTKSENLLNSPKKSGKQSAYWQMSACFVSLFFLRCLWLLMPQQLWGLKKHLGLLFSLICHHLCLISEVWRSSSISQRAILIEKCGLWNFFLLFVSQSLFVVIFCRFSNSKIYEIQSMIERRSVERRSPFSER